MAQSTTITGTSNAGANSATGKLFSALNPLELLNTAASGHPTQGVADPSLKTALLGQNDLPSGFIAMGDSTYNVPSQFGDLQLAASTFSSGDTASNQFGAMVLSAVVALPSDALDKLGNPSD